MPSAVRPTGVQVRNYIRFQILEKVRYLTRSAIRPCVQVRAAVGAEPMALPPGEQATASGVPVVALQQFLAALRARDFVGAKRLAFQSESLHLEPCPAVRAVGCTRARE